MYCRRIYKADEDIIEFFRRIRGAHGSYVNHLGVINSRTAGIQKCRMGGAYLTITWSDLTARLSPEFAKNAPVQSKTVRLHVVHNPNARC